MAKLSLDDLANLQNENSAVATVNNNNASIETAMEKTLSRDGTSPNQMGANFDMNSYRIINLPTPVNADEPLRLQDLSNFYSTGTVSNIPAGGNSGDVLAKTSDTDYIFGWVADSTLVTAGDNVVTTGTSPVTISTTLTPTFTTVNGMTLTASTGIFTLADAKTFTVSNTLTFTGTDGSSAAFGAGGTVAYKGSSLAQFASTTSLELAGVVSDETGSGALVFGTAPNITSPTGIVKGDVGLGNVDNTSDATKNSAVATLTNKSISGASNTLSDIANASLTNSSISIAGHSVALGGTQAIAIGDLSTISDGTIVSNISGGAAVPTANTITSVLDKLFGTAQGSVIYRDAASWSVLTPGTSGYFLKTLGAGANPSWASVPGGGDLLSTNNLSDLTNTTTALTNLGGTTVGQAVFIAADAAAARTAISISTEIGKIEHWPTSDVPAGRLRCNGGSYSRASYTDLVSVLIKTGTATFTNGSSNVGMTAHGRSVGDPIKLFTSGTLPTNFTAGTHGLVSAGTTYYVKTVVDANTVILATTVTGSAITAGSAGSGTHTWVNAPHGDGDGSTTFTVPQYCGEFLRGGDYGRGVDVGRAIGSSQSDALQGHWHTVNPTGSASTGVGSTFLRGGDATGGGITVQGKTIITDGVNGTPRIDVETRPRNISVNITIRYAA